MPSEAVSRREPRRSTGEGALAAALPSPAPLDLVEIPFVRATYKLEGRDERGNLPVDAYRLAYETTVASGARYRVVVEGSTQEGLPYGNDGDILVALFKLIDQHRWTDGLFRRPSVRMIADSLGLPMNGETAERIRGALLRLSHVRIWASATFRAEPLAQAIESAAEGGDPVVPDVGPPLRARRAEVKEEEVNWLLQYRWRTTFERSEGGEAWIEHLWVNPLWVAQAIAGWAAWIDTGAYTGLGGPVAKRLYQVMAACAARGRPAPWSFPLRELWAACAISPNARPNRVRDQLRAAGEELVAGGVLGRFAVEAGRKGQYTFVVTPGPLLRVAGGLRGVGMLDPEETRTQLLLLTQLGVNARVARSLVQEHANGLHYILWYLVYRSEQAAAGRAEPIGNTGGYLRRLVAEGFNPHGDAGFRSWYERRTGGMAGGPALLPALAEPGGTVSPGGTRGGTPGAPPQATMPEPPGSTTLPVVEPFRLEPRDPRAAECWAEAVVALLSETGADATLQVALSQVAPWAFEDEALVCVAASDLWAWRVRQRAGAALERILVEQTGGRVQRLRVRHELP